MSSSSVAASDGHVHSATPGGCALGTAIPAEVAEQAVRWWVALRAGEETAQTRLELQRWREADSLHEVAWQRIETMGSEMAGIPLPLARAALGAPASPRRRRSMQLLAVALVSGSGTAALLRSQSWRAWSAEAVAAVGEQRRLSLPDGGSVVLNTGSALNILYRADMRVLQLVRGEILVQTAPDAQRRPFSVQTALGSVRALGTRFMVREREQAFEVGVLEGAVELRPIDAAAGVLRLAAGERGWLGRVAAHRNGPLEPAAAAWADGMLVVSHMRLQDFLAELGRYRRGHLGCDPAIADLRVSGSYPLADTDKVLASLTSALPVQLRFFSRYWVSVQAAST